MTEIVPKAEPADERIQDEAGDELEHGEPDFPGQFPDDREGVLRLADTIRESLDANNAFEYNDDVNGVMTGFDGNKDVLAESLATDLLAAEPRSRVEGLREALAGLSYVTIRGVDMVNRDVVLALTPDRSRVEGLDPSGHDWDDMLEDVMGLWGPGDGVVDQDDVLEVLAEHRPYIEDRSRVEGLDVERLAKAMDAADPPITGDEDGGEDHAEHLAYARDIARQYTALTVEPVRSGDARE
jgi:hypothetical protein